MNANSNSLDGDWRRLDDDLNVLRRRTERLIVLAMSAVRRRPSRLHLTQAKVEEATLSLIASS